MKGKEKVNCSCNKCKEKLKIKELQMLHLIYYSNFYSNTELQDILPGYALNFKNNGPTNCFIFRLNDSQFNLTLIGIYEIFVSVYIQKQENQSQLIVKCNDKELLETKMINSDNHIYGYFLISTEMINSIVSINNPTSSKSNVNLLCYDEKDEPIYSHLIIKKIN